MAHSIDRIIVFDSDSIAKMYVGNWSDYETMMQEKFGKDYSASSEIPNVEEIMFS